MEDILNVLAFTYCKSASRQVTNMNVTEVSTNSTDVAPVGLTVGLPLGLLLLLAVIASAAALLYTWRCKSRSFPAAEEARKAEDGSQYTTSPRYVAASTMPTQAAQQSPIYENFQGGYGSVQGGAQGCHQTEDLYLQCDPQDEAIYNNDPSLPGYSAYFGPTEDEYVAPDAL
ncbi:hypothetical protein GN956_G3301 [Arapaima gigas]